jgi:hypothetical protein
MQKQQFQMIISLKMQKTMNCLFRLFDVFVIATILLMAILPSVKAADAEISFQEGVNGYTGTVDTFIMEAEPGSSHGTFESLEWDTDDPPGSGRLKFVLIRFDNIFGSGPGKIPEGAIIESATLSYTVYNTGDPAGVNEVLVDWFENATYSGFGGEAGVQADDYGAYVNQASGSALSVKTIDVTSSLAAWAIDPSKNRGWIFRPSGTNGVDFRSREYETTGNRPKLMVYFDTEPPSTPPDPPTLNAPIDGAVDVSTSPIMAVGVFDPDTASLTVTFHGREVSGDTAEDFTIIALPDTQFYSQSYPSIFTAQTQWIVDNKDAFNILYVAHEGDIVNTADSTSQWDNAVAAMSLLEVPSPPGSRTAFPMEWYRAITIPPQPITIIILAFPASMGGVITVVITTPTTTTTIPCSVPAAWTLLWSI